MDHDNDAALALGEQLRKHWQALLQVMLLVA
jgi:hypothetical protein